MLRQTAASIAVVLVALSVAAIVAAQDPASDQIATDQGTAHMHVRKLPPVTEVDPKAGVIKLDHFGQGSISRARLVDAEEAHGAPARLEVGHAQPMAGVTDVQAISPEKIQAAKQYAAHETKELTSAEQRDLGIVLAADWSAISKATRNGSRREMPRNANKPAPQGEAQQQQRGSSLQDKLNSLRDSITGEEPQIARPSNSRRPNYQPPQISTGAAYPSPGSNAPLGTPIATESMEPVARSSAPEAPSIPKVSSRTVRTGTPTLADPVGPTVAAPEKSPLESSRRRREPGSWNDLEKSSAVEVTSQMPPSSRTVNQLREQAAVSAEPIAPAIPSLADEPELAAEIEPTAEPTPEAVPAETVSTALATQTPAIAEPEDDRVLMSVAGPQITAQAVGPRRIVISRDAEFQVTVRNSGTVEANEVVVSVQLPSWVDVTGTQATRGTAQAAATGQVDQPLLWRIARLEANSSEVLKINLIPRRSQPLDMSVRWTYAQTATNTLVEVEEPMLQMVISGPNEAVYGQTKLYNLTLSNPGTGDAQNVVLSLLPLEGKQETAAVTKIGTLAHGETKTIQVELSAGKSGVLLVKANATADGGLTAEAAKEVLVRRANLVIEVVAPEAEYAGNAASFLVRVLNDGNASADDVTVNAVLPEGAEYVTSTADGRYEQKQGRVRWDIGSLAAGQMREFQMAAKLHAPGENRLHTTAQDKSDLNAVADVQTAVIARADLKLLVTDPQGPVPVGEEAVYELTIHNRGTQAAEAIEAVIFFSEGIEPIRVEGADHEIGSGQVMFKTIPQINSAGQMVLKVTARADRPGNHVFRAEVLCRSIGTKLAAEQPNRFATRCGTATCPSQDRPKPQPTATGQHRDEIDILSCGKDSPNVRGIDPTRTTQPLGTRNRYTCWRCVRVLHAPRLTRHRRR